METTEDLYGKEIKIIVVFNTGIVFEYQNEIFTLEDGGIEKGNLLLD